MNAGSSERGRHFACKHCDLVFTNIRTHDIATQPRMSPATIGWRARNTGAR